MRRHVARGLMRALGSYFCGHVQYSRVGCGGRLQSLLIVFSTTNIRPTRTATDAAVQADPKQHGLRHFRSHRQAMWKIWQMPAAKLTCADKVQMYQPAKKQGCRPSHAGACPSKMHKGSSTSEYRSLLMKGQNTPASYDQSN